MSALFVGALKKLSGNDPAAISLDVENIYQEYDQLVEQCATEYSRNRKTTDLSVLMIQRDLFFQLKEIGKRMHIAANSIEDMSLKLV